MQKLVFLWLMGAVASVHGDIRSDIQSCSYKDPSSGKVYDFSSLINPAGYYTFTQQVWSVNGYSLDSLVSDSQVNVTFYVQVCRNILNPPSACTDMGAVFSVTPDGKCMSWGNANVAAFDSNPFQDVTEVGRVTIPANTEQYDARNGSKVHTYRCTAKCSGANLKMYHGTALDHLATNAATIYFVCNQGLKNVRAEVPTFEHVKVALNQAHFKFYTHVAC